jgi:hypothetical protein
MAKTKMVSDMAKSEKSMKNAEKTDMKKLLENVKKGMIDLTSLKFSDSMDLLGIYEVHADDSGTIQTFRRVGMRKRSDAVTSEEY